VAYDHSTKVGNQGDVAKHLALFVALRHLLVTSDRTRRFAYADIHAGRPNYVLPHKGEWQFGIGRFSDLKEVKDDRKERGKNRTRKKQKPTPLGLLGEFDETVAGRRIRTGMVYPGSAGLAFRLLREAKADFTMKLWEQNQAAADDAQRHFYPWREQVGVVCGNGYEVTNETEPFTLVLIDPPSIDHAELALNTMQRLATAGSQYLCWMSRTARMVKREGEVPDNEERWSEEASTSTAYLGSAAKHGRCLRLLWNQEWGKNAGCSLTASSGIAPAVGAAVGQLARLMGWACEG
jgi:23S rRNA A2030 N6-methylase RlmJ